MTDSRLTLVLQALVQDTQTLLDGYLSNRSLPSGCWNSLFMSLHAARALIPGAPVRAIPPHLIGRVWKVTFNDDRPVAQIAYDDQINGCSYLVIADSAEQAVANILPS